MCQNRRYLHAQRSATELILGCSDALRERKLLSHFSNISVAEDRRHRPTAQSSHLRVSLRSHAARAPPWRCSDPPP